MSYIDGFVIAVPTANKQKFIDHARSSDSVFMELGALRNKATRDAGMSSMGDLMKTDDRFSAEKNPMPFDGRRMIYGGFTPVVTLNAGK